MSEASSSVPESSSAPEAKKPRNPVERIIVWGAILAGAVIIGAEATARFGYGSTLSRITTALEQDDSENHQPLTLVDAEKMIAGFPAKVDEQQGKLSSSVTYRWRGILKNYGAIQITYDTQEKYVTGVVTEGAEEEKDSPGPSDGATSGETATDTADAAPEMGPGGPGGPPGGGGGGGGGGGREFNMADFDTDADGKLTLAEAPEFWKDRFADIDTNGDGSLDPQEIENRPRRQRGPGGGGGPGGGTGGGGGFNPMQADADGDGKLSREETPERMRENFDEIDANQDGFIDESELEARRAARAQRPPME